MNKVLILVRGVQGSGKSTLAQMICNGFSIAVNPPHYEADMFFLGPDGYKWDGAKIGEAHRWCQMKVNDAMKENHRLIIVSNTFIKKAEMQPYLEMAQEHGYQVQEIICKGRFKNIHNVPEEKVEQKRRQFEF